LIQLHARTDRKWVIALPFAGADWQAYTTCLSRGIPALLPYTLSGSRRGRWTQGVVRPMYPGYFFAAIEGNKSTENVKRVIGIRDLLRDSAGLIFVPERMVLDCKKHWLAEYRSTAPMLKREITVNTGDWLSVPTGAFAGAPCKVESIDKSGNICASIGQLQITFRRSDVSQSAVRARAKPATFHK
jgi:transcription antitermination factor NusG